MEFIAATMGKREGGIAFADLLSVFAETVSETDPGEGTILESWAQAIAGVRE